MKVHFFKASSRLGIRYLPFGQREFATGVEDGPSAILTKKFISDLPDAKVSEFIFPKPEDINQDEYLDIVLKECLKFKTQLINDAKDDEMQIVIGGDHSVTFSSILADIQKHGENIGIIHFDSHADFNHLSESPSKNFHGMYLRIFFDHFDLPEFDATVPQKIPLSNLLFVGDLELDQEELSYFKKNKPQIIRSSDINRTEKAKDFVSRFNHIHISFDVDVFKESVAPATGTPSKNGFEREQIFEILKAIKESRKSFSIDICEVNPKKKGGERTVKLAQDIITQLIF